MIFNCFVVFVVVVIYIGFDGKIVYSDYEEKIVIVEFIDSLG